MHSSIASHSSGPRYRVCEAPDKAVAMQEGGLLENRGTALAYFVLGRCLHLGRGVSQQPDKAKELYDRVSCSRVPVFLMFHTQSHLIMPPPPTHTHIASGYQV